MTQLTEESLDWLWDNDNNKPQVRHWPAVTTGAVHVHDNSDLHELRQAAREVQDVDEWVDRYQAIMTADTYQVSVDTLADMLDHNRADCLGDATNLKGFSRTLFALERGEVLDELPLAARLALLTNGLVTIEHVLVDTEKVRAELEELRVADLHLLARQTDHISRRQRKADLIEDLIAAWDRGEVEILFGPVAPAPPLHGWLKTRIDMYVQALHTALGDPVYPLAFREAVWHKAIREASVPALKQAIELEYWDVLEAEIDDTSVPDTDPEGPDDPAGAAGDWTPGVSAPGQYKGLAWLVLGLLVLFWLFR